MNGAGDTLTIQEIHARHEFQALRPEWNALVEASGLASPFLLHEWFTCCLAHAPERDLRVLLVRDADRLIGIAPLWMTTLVVRGLALRVLAFISCPETASADFIIQPQHRLRALEAALRHLFAGERISWDGVALSQWPVESPNFQMTAAIAGRHGWPVIRGTASLAPFISIRGAWEEFLGEKSYLFRKSRRGILNRMARVEGVTVERITRARDAGVLQDLIWISERSQKHRMGVSLASSAESLRFFEALTEASGTGGWLDLWLLRIRGAPVAFEYDLVRDGVVYALRAEFDEAYANLSPGAYLEYQLLQACFEGRRREYSSGPGLDDYKLRWTNQRRENGILTICTPTWRGRWLWWTEGRLWPLLRRVKAHLSPPHAVSNGEDAAPAPPPGSGGTP